MDKGGFYKPPEIQKLDSIIKLIKQKTNTDFLLYTTNDLDAYTPKEYSQDLMTNENLKNKLHNSVVFLISKNDHKIHIEPDYGTAWVLPDVLNKKIIQNMLPYFIENQYYQGTLNALQKINNQLKKLDWTILEKDLTGIKSKDQGKIIKFTYRQNITPNEDDYFDDYETEEELAGQPQFSKNYFIPLQTNNGDIYKLYYSKYMKALKYQITHQNTTIIYARLLNAKDKSLLLIGLYDEKDL